MYVYIMTNSNNTTLYVGVTNDIVRRVWEHKNNINNGFTARYNLHKLVYYECYEDEETSIEREKNLKKAFRRIKDKLIESQNGHWNDLYENFVPLE